MLVCMVKLPSLLKHTAAVLLVLSVPAVGLAQLIPVGMPLPVNAHPPAVFLNGYQESCSGSSFSGTFGIADQVLAASGINSVFFDNCTVSGKPPIEDLGAAFGVF